MEQSPREANRSLASQAVPCILWNPKVYYRVYNGPPLLHLLNQIDEVNVKLSVCLIKHHIMKM